MKLIEIMSSFRSVLVGIECETAKYCALIELFFVYTSISISLILILLSIIVLMLINWHGITRSKNVQTTCKKCDEAAKTLEKKNKAAKTPHDLLNEELKLNSRFQEKLGKYLDDLEIEPETRAGLYSVISSHVLVPYRAAAVLDDIIIEDETEEVLSKKSEDTIRMIDSSVGLKVETNLELEGFWNWKKDESKVEVKKNESKGEVKKNESKGEVKKDESKGGLKKDESRGKVKNDESKGELKKDESKEVVKKNESKGEVMKNESKGEVKKDESKGEVKKDESKGASIFKKIMKDESKDFVCEIKDVICD